MADSREIVLARIRTALAGVVRPPAGRGDRPDRRPIEPSQALVRDFVRSSEAVGTSVSVVERVEDARRRLDEILDEESASTIVVSPDAARAPWLCGTDSRHRSRKQFITRSPQTNDIAGELLIADAGVTTAPYAMAGTGTLLVFSSSEQHRLDSLVPPVHVALLRASGVFGGLPELLARLVDERRFARHSAVTLITGPSRTADIELTLTVGVHGPRKLHVIVLNDVAP